jgi:hypothetical protein
VTRDAGGGGRRLFFVFFNFLLPIVSFISRENIRAEGMIEGLQHTIMTSMTVIRPRCLRTRLPTTLPAPSLLRGTSTAHALYHPACARGRGVQLATRGCGDSPPWHPAAGPSFSRLLRGKGRTNRAFVRATRRCLSKTSFLQLL